MKTIISTIFILLVITVQGQKKKDLTSELKEYRYGVVMNATYDVKQDVLEKNIKEYLSKFGYSKSINPDDGMLFRISHSRGSNISKNPPKGQAPLEEKGVKSATVKPVVKTKPQKYKTSLYTTVRELILDVDGEESLSVILNENSFPTPGKDNKIHRGYFTINKMFYELKKYLYVRYHEDFIELPEDLIARVNTFNDTKTSDRKKIDLQDY